jgi:hypothetical protein
LHNNGFTGIDQPNTYSRRLEMTKQKQMADKVELSDEELDGVAGGLISIAIITAFTGSKCSPDHPAGPGRKLLGNPLGYRCGDGSDA